MWVRGGASLSVCPVSYVTADSIAILEEFCARKLLSSSGDILEMRGKVVDGFQALESELAGEKANDNRQLG